MTTGFVRNFCAHLDIDQGPQMVQQMEIYEQGCKLIVSVHLLSPNWKLTFLDRLQVRTYSPFYNRSLT